MFPRINHTNPLDFASEEKSRIAAQLGRPQFNCKPKTQPIAVEFLHSVMSDTVLD